MAKKIYHIVTFFRKDAANAQRFLNEKAKAGYAVEEYSMCAFGLNDRGILDSKKNRATAGIVCKVYESTKEVHVHMYLNIL